MKSLCAVSPVHFPEPSGIIINMMPFVMGQEDTLPSEFRGYLPLIAACNLEAEQIGKTGYLSIQENPVTRGSHRRPGIHVEGHPANGWGGGWGRGRFAESRSDGLYMASTVGNSCRAWDVHMDSPGLAGDCEAFRDQLAERDAVYMQPGMLYWMTDRCPHESLPLEVGMFRQWFRLVTHKVDLWFQNHSTENPLGIRPACGIIRGNKFAGPTNATDRSS